MQKRAEIEARKADRKRKAEANKTEKEARKKVRLESQQAKASQNSKKHAHEDLMKQLLLLQVGEAKSATSRVGRITKAPAWLGDEQIL
jgi:hypothetical protein